uniref:Uncharacterized protein n=1 Tax=Glossina pallidipes TaxID=7398 RepID=A0A1A9ZYA4_GLOPL
MLCRSLRYRQVYVLSRAAQYEDSLATLTEQVFAKEFSSSSYEVLGNEITVTSFLSPKRVALLGSSFANTDLVVGNVNQTFPVVSPASLTIFFVSGLISFISDTKDLLSPIINFFK